MNRRFFIRSGGLLGAVSWLAGGRARRRAAAGGPPNALEPVSTASSPSPPSTIDVRRDKAHSTVDDIRDAFPRLENETYLNAAGMMPLGAFSEAGLNRFMDFQRLGPADDRGAYIGRMQSGIREMFADLIGARVDEIGLVHCTKSGEQIVLDGLPELRSGGNIVTNDLHFSGSLHNLAGLQASGIDVRFVRSTDWRVTAEKMATAIFDARTALVAVSLVSNVNGHVEDITALSEVAHARGAIVYADIIQAAGIVPVDVDSMGIDVAACSCYKWLYGVHGTAFLYVRKSLQGTRLRDWLFPGHARHNYRPWVAQPDPAFGDFGLDMPDDARRYQPGHVSYLGYCAAFEGLQFLREVGVPDALSHSVRLNQRLRNQIDLQRYPCITPDPDVVPINSFLVDDTAELQNRLEAANVVVSLSDGRMRVSPALYNNEEDVDRLVAVLNG